ncbi:O-antigen ligase family protein [Micromonospora sp. DT81.3]|uniref:O-antigen ligase family protein n=1 Tax=Micromonospora sp. DT81.3 TaxID=3416523 RepID=UPI003CEF7A75
MTPPYLVAGRTEWNHRLRSAAVFVVAVAFTGITTVGLLATVEQPSYELALAIPLLTVLVLGVFLMPVHMIPAVVGAVLCVVPTRFVPNDGPFNALPPLALVMGIWVLRRIVLAHGAGRASRLPPLSRIGPRLAVYTFAVLLVAWLGVSILRSGVNETTVGWTLAFVVSALVPLLVFDARQEVALLRTVLLIGGALAGANIMVELVLGMSPVYGWLGGSREFGFAVYRAQGPFSHPLFAAAFLTVPAMLGIGTWLTTGRRWMLLCGGLAAGGVLATVSRGSIVALGVAVGVAVIAAPFFLGWRNVGRWFVFVGLAGLGAVVALNFGPLVERASSIESQLSAGVRERAITVAVSAAEYSDWFGTGPGTSGQTGRLFDTIVIENSLLQLLISIGLPGLVLFVLFLSSLIWSAWARGDLAVGLAIIAYTVSISSFNSLDAVRGMHIVIGLLVLLAVHDSTPRPRPEEFEPLSAGRVMQPTSG